MSPATGRARIIACRSHTSAQREKYVAKPSTLRASGPCLPSGRRSASTSHMPGRRRRSADEPAHRGREPSRPRRSRPASRPRRRTARRGRSRTTAPRRRTGRARSRRTAAAASSASSATSSDASASALTSRPTRRRRRSPSTSRAVMPTRCRSFQRRRPAWRSSTSSRHASAFRALSTSVGFGCVRSRSEVGEPSDEVGIVQQRRPRPSGSCRRARTTRRAASGESRNSDASSVERCAPDARLRRHKQALIRIGRVGEPARAAAAASAASAATSG